MNEPIDYINNPPETEFTRQVERISDMAKMVSLSPGDPGTGFLISVIFTLPNGKTEAFDFPVNNPGKLADKLWTILPDEVDMRADGTTGGKISGEVVDAILRNWYYRINSKTG